MGWLERTELLFGESVVDELSRRRVLVVGVGGVGAYAAEMIVRAGVGEIMIVDGDVVQPSNINRQLVALQTTIGASKVEVLRERLLSINPALKITVLQQYLDVPEIDQLLSENSFDFIVDAIDTVTPKVYLLSKALDLNLRVISSMGAGGRIDPSKVMLSTLPKTFNCGLAKVVRTRLKKERKGAKLPVVFSSELSDKSAVIPTEGERHKKSTVGTVSYMPAIFGCHLASYVIRELVRQIRLEQESQQAASMVEE